MKLEKFGINGKPLNLKIQSISTNTEKKLFDLSKPVPNELIFWTFGSIFVICVMIAVWIHVYAKKNWYN